MSGRNDASLQSLLDKQPPCNLDAEKAVLASMIVRPDVALDVSAILVDEDFYADENARLYRTLLSLCDKGREIDATSLATELKRTGNFDAVGGVVTIGELFSLNPVAANAQFYATEVREKSDVRRMRYLHIEGLRHASESDIAATDLIDDAEQALNGIVNRGRESKAIDSVEAVEGALAVARDSLNGRQRGLSTGLANFDRDIGGLFPGELSILAARPRIGKTALAAQIMGENARRGRHVLFVSLEMAAEEMTLRLLCTRADVNGNRIRTGALTDDDFCALEEAGSDLRQAQFHLAGKFDLTVPDIRRTARLLQRQAGLRLVIVDYLQRLEPTDHRVQRHEQVGQMVSGLKSLARELEIPVLCLAQLNREVESTKDHVPHLGHLRESGQVEQDADVVMFLHRPEVYNRKDLTLRGKAELHVVKNRNGPTAVFELQWVDELTTFRTPAVEMHQSWERFVEPTSF